MKHLALLMVFINTIKPAIEKGNQVEYVLLGFISDGNATEPELVKLIIELNNKVSFYYQDKSSGIRKTYVQIVYNKITNKCLELVKQSKEVYLCI